MKVFQFLVFWAPTEKQFDEGNRPKIIVDLQTVIATDDRSVQVAAARAIPKEYEDALEQVTVVVRPF